MKNGNLAILLEHYCKKHSLTDCFGTFVTLKLYTDGSGDVVSARDGEHETILFSFCSFEELLGVLNN